MMSDVYKADKDPAKIIIVKIEWGAGGRGLKGKHFCPTEHRPTRAEEKAHRSSAAGPNGWDSGKAVPWDTQPRLLWPTTASSRGP